MFILNTEIIVDNFVTLHSVYIWHTSYLHAWTFPTYVLPLVLVSACCDKPLFDIRTLEKHCHCHARQSLVLFWWPSAMPLKNLKYYLSCRRYVPARVWHAEPVILEQFSSERCGVTYILRLLCSIGLFPLPSMPVIFLFHEETGKKVWLWWWW